VGPGFSPLDERLGLLPGSALTPSLVDSVVRLGATVPFAQAADLLAHFTGVRVGSETVRRLTEAAGAVQVAIETMAVANLERQLPTPPSGPPVQLLSVDGAMVPLVGGEWGEAKTLALGEVVATDEGPRTVALSYFSRLTDAATFGRLATLETQRRGTPTASTVVAVTDGAVWCQGFIDLHRPDAVRVLDFPHALEHLGTVAQAMFGPGTATGSDWLGRQAQRLRHGQEAQVLTDLADLAARESRSEVRTVLTTTHTYLATRVALICYQAFVAAGYPIGSGCVESANKLVVEARLKGAGMHWARGNIDPLLALRGLLANDRWAEAWPVLWRRLCAVRRAPRPTPAVPCAPLYANAPLGPPPPSPLVPTVDPLAPKPKLIINGKPTANHPWKRGLLPRAKF
jgi:hypothetical protein